jgi:hypothetical protein
MGYTHYYYVEPEFDADQFKKVAEDFLKMRPVLSHLGVKLGDGWGENEPTITPTEIRFNGFAKCGHRNEDLGIVWPKKGAKGITKNSIGRELEQVVGGSWFAGAQLETRACGGDCSHETFGLEQKMSEIPEWKKDDADAGKKIFECTKTAYKPYDLAVNVVLIIAKKHLKNHIKIRSDGDIENWEEGMQLCQHFLGYGEDFRLDEDGE